MISKLVSQISGIEPCLNLKVTLKQVRNYAVSTINRVEWIVHARYFALNVGSYRLEGPVLDIACQGLIEARSLQCKLCGTFSVVFNAKTHVGRIHSQFHASSNLRVLYLLASACSTPFFGIPCCC